MRSSKKKEKKKEKEIGLPTDLRNCQLRRDMAISLNNHYYLVQAFMVMFGEEAHRFQAMMRETMSPTAVSIIIEKPIFDEEKMPLTGSDPSHNASMLFYTHALDWIQSPDHKLTTPMS